MALAIHISVAWRMLLLRWASREPETLHASQVLTSKQAKVLFCDGEEDELLAL